MNRLLSRTIKIGIFLNLPPILIEVMALLKLDIFPVIMAALLWANIPLQDLGMASLFSQHQVSFEEWGVTQAAPIVWFSVVAFWMLVAALISYVSLLRIKRDKQ